MKKDFIKIERKITNEDLKKCFYIDFEVPEGVEEMNITHNWVPREEGNLDFGLVGPDGKQVGATGNVYQSVTISEKYSTPGYKKCTPLPGSWKMIIAVDRAGKGVTATYEIRFRFKERRWLCGDNHLHTVHSDGKCTPQQLVEKGKKKGLDYIIITDHNNFIATEERYNDPDLLVIKGVELTSFQGHMNFWGLKEPFDTPYCVNNFDDFLAVHKQALENGAVISMNHPECKLCGWHLPREGYHYDCAEIWNGPQRIDNMNAVKWWHSELLKGKKLSAVGGSDYHKDYYITDLFARPVTFVCAESCTEKDILKALKDGHAFVTATPNGAKLFLTSGDAIQGDAVKFSENKTVKIEALNMRRGDTLLVYNNDEIIYKYEAGKKGNHTAEIAVKEKGFVRAEIITQYKNVKAAIYKFAVGFALPADKKLPIPPFARCVSNPIYFE